MRSEINDWVQTMQEEYLPTSKYEGDGTIDEVFERAIEAIGSDLMRALRDAEAEWWDETCNVCEGECTCLDCEGEGGTDEGECETCNGSGVCPHCEGTGKEHLEK